MIPMHAPAPGVSRDRFSMQSKRAHDKGLCWRSLEICPLAAIGNCPEATSPVTECDWMRSYVTGAAAT